MIIFFPCQVISNPCGCLKRKVCMRFAHATIPLRILPRCTFPWKGIQMAKDPQKVPFFEWTATLEKILAIDNLQKKRHILIIDLCCLCKSIRESIDHLPLHCSLATYMDFRLWASLRDAQKKGGFFMELSVLLLSSRSIFCTLCLIGCLL